MAKVKLEVTENRRRLHIGSYFTDLNESEYRDLVKIFSAPPPGLLEEKLEFYREQTDNVRQLVFNSKEIGEPCLPLYDAICDKINKQKAEIERLNKELNEYKFNF